VSLGIPEAFLFYPIKSFSSLMGSSPKENSVIHLIALADILTNTAEPETFWESLI